MTIRQRCATVLSVCLAGFGDGAEGARDTAKG